MGTWCQVNCNCPNRIPVDPNKPENSLYQCGHDNGIFYETWPKPFFTVGQILRNMFEDDPQWLRTFEVFLWITDGDTHYDQHVSMPPSKRDAWRLEIDELLAFFRGDRVFPHKATQKWNSFWEHFAQGQTRYTNPVTAESILQTALELCDASEKMGQPIDFYL